MYTDFISPVPFPFYPPPLVPPLSQSSFSAAAVAICFLNVCHSGKGEINLNLNLCATWKYASLDIQPSLTGR